MGYDNIPFPSLDDKKDITIEFVPQKMANCSPPAGNRHPAQPVLLIKANRAGFLSILPALRSSTARRSATNAGVSTIQAAAEAAKCRYYPPPWRAARRARTRGRRETPPPFHASQTPRLCDGSRYPAATRILYASCVQRRTARPSGNIALAEKRAAAPPAAAYRRQRVRPGVFKPRKPKLPKYRGFRPRPLWDAAQPSGSATFSSTLRHASRDPAAASGKRMGVARTSWLFT